MLDLDNKNNFEEEYADDLDYKVDLLLSRDRADEAIKILREAEEQYPWRRSIKKKLARAYILLKDYISAMAIIQMIEPELSADFEIPAMHSVIYKVFKKDNFNAEKYEEKALQLAYYKDDVYFYICYILCKLGLYTDSYNYVKKALKFNRNDPVIWDHRAFLEYMLGKYYAMEKCLQIELSIDPTLALDSNFDSYHGFFLAYYYSGRFKKALEVCKNVPIEYFEDECGLILMAQVFRLYGNDNKAEAIIKNIFKNNKEKSLDLMGIINLGEMSHTIIDIEKEPETFNFLATYIRQLVCSENPMISKGVKLLLLGLHEDAIRLLEHIPEYIPKDDSTVLDVAIAYACLMLGEIHKVIHWLENAILKSKDRYTCWFYLHFITENQKIIEYLNKYYEEQLEVSRLIVETVGNEYLDDIYDDIRIAKRNINSYKKQIFSKKVIKKGIDCYKFLIHNDSINKQIYKTKMAKYTRDLKAYKDKVNCRHQCVQMHLF